MVNVETLFGSTGAMWLLKGSLLRSLKHLKHLPLCCRFVIWIFEKLVISVRFLACRLSLEFVLSSTIVTQATHLCRHDAFSPPPVSPASFIGTYRSSKKWRFIRKLGAWPCSAAPYQHSFSICRIWASSPTRPWQSSAQRTLFPFWLTYGYSNTKRNYSTHGTWWAPF